MQRRSEIEEFVQMRMIRVCTKQQREEWHRQEHMTEQELEQA